MPKFTYHTPNLTTLVACCTLETSIMIWPPVHFDTWFHTCEYVRWHQFQLAFILYSVSQKSNPTKTICNIFSLGKSVIENYFGCCPTIFLRVYQFWFIYLNIYVNCITFTSNTPQILTTLYTLLLN